MDRKQLISEIANKEDNNTYKLILKTNGKFELIEKQEWLDNEDSYDYVTDWEYFFKGDNYVGKSASKDEYYINDIYSWAEEAWNRYKKFGESKILNLYLL